MNAKQKIMLFTFALWFSTAVVANAEEKTTPEKPSAAPEKSQHATPAKKKAKPHSHAVEKGVMPPDAASPEAKEERNASEMPMHEHTKERR